MMPVIKSFKYNLNWLRMYLRIYVYMYDYKFLYQGDSKQLVNTPILH